MLLVLVYCCTTMTFKGTLQGKHAEVEIELLQRQYTEFNVRLLQSLVVLLVAHSSSLMF